MQDARKTKAALIEELRSLRRARAGKTMKDQAGEVEQRLSHLNQVLRAIRDVNKLITKEKNQQKIIERVCEILVEGRSYKSAWVVLFHADGSYAVGAEAGVGRAFGNLTERIKSGGVLGCVRQCIENRGGAPAVATPNVCKGCPSNPKEPPMACAYVRLEYEGELLGVLTVSVFDVERLDDEEKSLLGELASDIAFAVRSLRLDEQRREAEDALWQKNQVFEDSIAALSIADTSGIITEVNPAFLTLWGHRTKEEAIGGSVGSFFVNEEDAGPVLEALGTSGRWDGEFLAKRADGGRFISRGLATAMKNERGELTGYQSANLDVTEQRRAEEALKKLQAQLESRVKERTAELIAANKELEAFAYSISHDLRTPLRGIDGFSKALLEDYQDKLDATAKDYLERVRAATQRMGTLIDDLLKLSRLTRAEMSRQRLDLGGLAGTIAHRLQQDEPDRNVEFEIGSHLVARGDRALVEAALENLLSNAWKFTGRREHARIQVGVSEQNGEPVYYVRDDGAGFDMAYADKLFGPFQRLHDTNEFPGTGIGLAIVYRVIVRHGGRIWAKGEVGKGATFYFTLPQTQPSNGNKGAEL